MNPTPHTPPPMTAADAPTPAADAPDTAAARNAAYRVGRVGGEIEAAVGYGDAGLAVAHLTGWAEELRIYGGALSDAVDALADALDAARRERDEARGQARDDRAQLAHADKRIADLTRERDGLLIDRRAERERAEAAEAALRVARDENARLARQAATERDAAKAAEAEAALLRAAMPDPEWLEIIAVDLGSTGIQWAEDNQRIAGDTAAAIRAALATKEADHAE